MQRIRLIRASRRLYGDQGVSIAEPIDGNAGPEVDVDAGGSTVSGVPSVLNLVLPVAAIDGVIAAQSLEAVVGRISDQGVRKAGGPDALDILERVGKAPGIDQGGGIQVNLDAGLDRRVGVAPTERHHIRAVAAIDRVGAPVPVDEVVAVAAVDRVVAVNALQGVGVDAADNEVGSSMYHRMDRAGEVARCQEPGVIEIEQVDAQAGVRDVLDRPGHIEHQQRIDQAARRYPRSVERHGAAIQYHLDARRVGVGDAGRGGCGAGGAGLIDDREIDTDWRGVGNGFGCHGSIAPSSNCPFSSPWGGLSYRPGPGGIPWCGLPIGRIDYGKLTRFCHRSNMNGRSVTILIVVLSHHAIIAVIAELDPVIPERLEILPFQWSVLTEMPGTSPGMTMGMAQSAAMRTGGRPASAGPGLPTEPRWMFRCLGSDRLR